MFAIEVVRFDAQDVIATSSNCPATATSLHVYVQNGTYTAYEYDGETFKKANISLGTTFANAAANSEAGWYAFKVTSSGNVSIGYTNGALSASNKCDPSLYHPVQ